MNYSKIKKIISILLVVIGAIAIISEISSVTKNYYVQSVGVVFLMLGVFLVNTNVKSKTKIDSDPYLEEEE
ncbi:hypothetical protein ATE84_3779 [Aquimarina sp. MAR_2010_214]|uniref:hypothetical protein n=1 Tax=Aquimarina sp. MAR_2010_214 TaxID=1250026 RepID=UPI000C702495|nr:hypothetical protein [Aquimarina sp. MAR_2010_214]PKV51687.1 hypothetical protein ATE84_3779 [Aquimarina sp. MAR_2010_214]